MLCVCKYLWRPEEGASSCGTGVAVSHGPWVLGTKTLWKSLARSQLLSHLCSPVAAFFLRNFVLQVFLSFLLFDLGTLCPSPSSIPFPFLLCLPSVDRLCKELSGSPDLTRSFLKNRLRKTRHYVLPYTFYNHPGNLVTTLQFKPGLKATKIAPNAN